MKHPSRLASIEKIKKAIKKNKNPHLYKLLANLLRKEGCFKEALRCIQKSPEEDPKSRFFIKAQIFLDQNNYEKAAYFFEQVILRDPQHMTALRSLSEIYIHLNNEKKMKNIYKIFSLYYPDDPFVQEIKNKLNRHHLQNMDFFEEKSLSEVARCMKNAEIESKPRIRPLQSSAPKNFSI